MQTPQPPTIDYRQPDPIRVSDTRFGPAATLLLLANTLLGGAMVLAIFYVDRLGIAGWLMLVCGTLMIYIVMGCLTRDVPRIKRALVLAIPAFLLAGGSLCLNWVTTDKLEKQILSRGTGSVVIVYFETDQGGELTTLLLACKISTAAALASLGLVGLITARLSRIRRQVSGQRGSGENA